jgi:hypothetical protein
VTVDQRLDTFTGPHLEWAGRSSTVSANPALPERFHVRVELQHLIRLPRLAAVLFLVRTQLRLGRILAELPEDTTEYNGVSRYGKAASVWLLTTRLTAEQHTSRPSLVVESTHRILQGRCCLHSQPQPRWARHSICSWWMRGGQLRGLQGTSFPRQILGTSQQRN